MVAELGWKVEAGVVSVPVNEDNAVKGKMIGEVVELNRESSFHHNPCGGLVRINDVGGMSLSRSLTLYPYLAVNRARQDHRCRRKLDALRSRICRDSCCCPFLPHFVLSPLDSALPTPEPSHFASWLRSQHLSLTFLFGRMIFWARQGVSVPTRGRTPKSKRKVGSMASSVD